jgi:peptidylprolyl isomerase
VTPALTGILAGALALASGCNKTEKKAPAPTTEPAKPATTPPPPAAKAPEPELPPEPPGPPPPADVKEPPADAEKTASGLASKVIEPGTGKEKPAVTDQVKVHYTGWTTDGRRFDSSVGRGEPITFPLNRVIPGWTEGVQLMTKGEKRRLWIPGKLAYGEGARQPGGPPTGPLVFDVELIDIIKPVPPPPAPKDVAKAPAGAKKTASGIAYRVLTKGTGKDHPAPTNTVEVHYTGWTTDGKMFDSSVVRGQPATFPLNQVIPGWTEGVQLMVVGEKTRFWIPGKLGYGEGNTVPGGPPLGTLVFDIELLAIK